MDDTVQSFHGCGENVEVTKSFTYLGGTVHDGAVNLLRQPRFKSETTHDSSSSIWKKYNVINIDGFLNLLIIKNKISTSFFKIVK